MILRAAAVVGLTMLPTAVMAQDGPTQAEFAAASAAGDRLDSGRYLDATEALRPLAFDAAGKPKPGFLYDQWAELRTLMTAEPVEPEPVPAQTAEARAMEDRVAAASLREAIPEIVARAAQTRVVILNENHGLPRDRAFALEVARALRPLGYSVLAAETFMVGDKGVAMSKLAKQGYPTQGTGYYTQDPVFGDFVRRSLALGYRPLSYEQTEEERGEPAGRAESIARREEAQANHLARALAASPEAKVFIYVGFSHVAERPIKGSDGDAPISWMAARLKAKTGIDPLTIDQVTLGPGAGRDTGLARRALAAKGLQRSTVLLKGDRPVTVGRYADAVDLQVYHPATRMVKGRPDWLAAMGRKPMAIPAGFVPQKGERLVQAFIAGESDDAIPVDQVLLRAGEDVPALLVPGDKPLRLVMQDPTPSPNGLRAKP